jgi:hypothetical protein
MSDYRITSPNLRILRGSADAPELIEVQTYTPDLIAYDRTRARHRWPELKDNMFGWMVFIGWHACRREGRIPSDLTYEQWEASILDVSSAIDDDDDAPADPTRPGHAPG